MREQWLKQERFAVWGAGVSGVAAANLLARRGKEVVLSDIKTLDELEDVAERLHSAVRLVGGENYLGESQVIVASPGMKPAHPDFERARAQGCAIISEVELAYDASQARWIGITGTDGKTTTTSLVGQMLQQADVEHVVAGNIGLPLCAVVETLGPEAVVVAELSAFQLWSCHHLQPLAAAITNVAADHLDYFESFADYAQAKLRIFELQRGEGSAVVPMRDRLVRKSLREPQGQRIIGFSDRPEDVAPLDEAVWFDGDQGWAREEEGVDICWLESFDETELFGSHNQLNLACAAALARSVGVSWAHIVEAALSFEPLAHRMEFVGEGNEVSFVDDSKATNAHASLAGLQNLEAGFVVIAGGVDKGLDLRSWAKYVAREAGAVVLLGQISERMRTELEGAGAAKIRSAESMENAVEQAFKMARPGSTVVLSPACSSFDMFESYAHRGREFQAAVERLISSLP
ncbi:UDP-N-acetylmuramoyl-L-alanine--D-glutamate ligase [Lujinxingia litoralis]|uniref:UDP-N-acetylmuramoylalanine--D-glutamate ligase n=1 Tax=Lujinxingia litoralis TaxID=2211119 RepID=A0A328C9K2_9DELT|nr:UDP-N-acetylmuramoyl-L-alanine--D-glutamate ligase [Lujinxingia litoralis]RAL23618.1 UDP-N-acetylmuramoyl-L-alanine--D-glutamate ligase [Lujinxingia litoralis]